MALTSTLYTGLSGLDVNQTKLNVVGNNIANANTVAFKSSRALFKPQFYVTDNGGSPPSADFGGTNPSQRGLGATVASIEKDFTQGSIEPTGKSTDMAIDGAGFFVVQGSQQQFTRDGSFTTNAADQLVTTGGEFVQGFGVDASGNILGGNLQNITIPVGTTSSAKATQNAEIDGNLNAGGAIAKGASILTSELVTQVGGGGPPATSDLLTNIAATSDNATPLFTVGQTFNYSGKKGGRDLPAQTFTVSGTSTLQDLNTFFQKSAGINTSVPASTDPTVPTPGVTVETDATDPTSARLVITGNLGTQNALSVPATAFATASGFTPLQFDDGTNAAGIKSNPEGESVHTSFVGYDSLGTPVTVGITATLESTSNTGNTWRFYADSGDNKTGDLAIGTGTMTFSTDGKLLGSTGTSIVVDRTNTGARTPLTVKLDFSKMTSLTSKDSSLAMTQQDGSAIGTLNAYSIGNDGTITGSFSNGLTKTLGQVAVATFNNPEGLEDHGGNMFTPSASSGVPIISAPQKLGAGSIRAGALEGSNVDLSTEFVNMIIATTGFSSASRVISTANQLITELLNSSR